MVEQVQREETLATSSRSWCAALTSSRGSATWSCGTRRIPHGHGPDSGEPRGPDARRGAADRPGGLPAGIPPSDAADPLHAQPPAVHEINRAMLDLAADMPESVCGVDLAGPDTLLCRSGWRVRGPVPLRTVAGSEDHLPSLRDAERLIPRAAAVPGPDRASGPRFPCGTRAAAGDRGAPAVPGGVPHHLPEDGDAGAPLPAAERLRAVRGGGGGDRRLHRQRGYAQRTPAVGVREPADARRDQLHQLLACQDAAFRHAFAWPHAQPPRTLLTSLALG